LNILFGNMSEHAERVWKNLAWGATVLGGILVSGTFWAGVFDPLIFDSTGESRTDGIFPILSPLLFRLSMTLHFGWIKGLPLFFVGVGALVFLHGRKSVGLAVVRSRPFTAVALSIVVLSHAVIFAISAQFFFVPEGSHIRPMGWAMFVAIVSLMTFVLVAPVSIVATIREKPRFLGIVGLVGGFTPFFFSSFILNFAAWVKGFELSP